MRRGVAEAKDVVMSDVGCAKRGWTAEQIEQLKSARRRRRIAKRMRRRASKEEMAVVGASSGDVVVGVVRVDAVPVKAATELHVAGSDEPMEPVAKVRVAELKVIGEALVEDLGRAASSGSPTGSMELAGGAIWAQRAHNVKAFLKTPDAKGHGKKVKKIIGNAAWSTDEAVAAQVFDDLVAQLPGL